MLTYLLMLALQVAILVAIACSLHWLFRSRPGVQYFVWLATIVSVGLAIPLQSQIPSLEMEIPVTAREPVSPVIESHVEADSRVDSKQLAQTVAIEGTPVLLQETAAPDDTVSATPVFSSALLQKKATRIAVWQWFAIAYATIVIMLGLRLLTGIWALHRLAKSARSPQFSGIVVEPIAQQFGLRRNVCVMVSERVKVPMAFGIIRPIVLLPEGFETWCEEAQQAVLLHEFSHVQRCDAFWDLVSRSIGIAWWFHPAVHFAVRRLRLTRERATDRLVLSHGVSPTVYATQLLEVAASSMRPNQPAMYMSCQGDIKNRIETILSCVPSAPEKSWKLKFALLAGFLVFASVSLRVSYATIRAQDETDSVVAKKQPTKPEDVTGKTFFERVQQVEPREVKGATKTVSISGRVIDKEGNPVSDAIVVFRDASVTLAMGTGAINDVLAKTTSRPDGSYSFEILVPYDQLDFSSGQLFCVSEKKIGLNYFQPRKPGRDSFENVDIEVVDTVAVKGKVVDADGNPVSGTRVRIGYLSEPVEGVEKQNPFYDRLINPRSTTDERGHFELPGLPAGFVVFLILDHPEFAITHGRIRTTKDHPEFIVHSSKHRLDVADNGATVPLTKGVEFRGTVTDGEGNSIEGARVSTDWRSCATDASGRFSIRAVDSEMDSMDLFVTNGFSRIFHVEQSKLKDGTANLQFLKPATIKGKVVSAHSGQPIEGFHVRFDPEDSSGMVYSDDTDANGGFEESIESGKIKMTLRSHDARLFAEKAFGDGWEPLDRDLSGGGQMFGTFEVKSGETKEITIRVPVRGSTRVKVLDTDGNPVAGAAVGFQTQVGLPVPGSRTGDDGLAGIDLPSGTVRPRRLFARFEKDGEIFFANVAVDSAVEVQELRLRPSIKISGRVMTNDKPLADVKLLIKRPNGRQPSFTVANAKTDERGYYTAELSRDVKTIPNYRIVIEPSDGIPNKEVGLGVAKPRLVDGQLKADVKLVHGDGEIAGVVVNAANEPVSNVLVRVDQLVMRSPERKEIHAGQFFEPASTYTDAEGNFKIRGLLEGFDAIVFAEVPTRITRGASMVKVGERGCRILVTEGEESGIDLLYR